jgi:V8-like Glu-specific endopeptidase
MPPPSVAAQMTKRIAMANRQVLRFMLAGVFALGLAATTLALGVGATGRPSVPVSQTSSGVSRIGALYANATTNQHGCTASVVDSPGGNTLITAAHCVSGSGAGMVFAPGEQGGTAPYGRWRVTAVHLAPSWLARQDPDVDVAFLTVARRMIHGHLTTIQRVTGGYRLGSTARQGERVTVTGYPAGTSNDPITCRPSTYLTHEYPTFDCRGYVGGTSGAPWLHAAKRGLEVVGVIGGLHQGGCVDSTSYSSPLGGAAAVAYFRASVGVASDDAPMPDSDGCT